ncbi:MAG: hypothetical protein ABIN96_11560 [Rubrivivax sp.]
MTLSSFRLTALALLALAAAAPAAHAADVGVSVQISQPGVYGRVDIGRFPQPVVVVQQPVIVRQPAYRDRRAAPVVQPVYLWVPPGHRKHWSKHCAHYGACGTPVYFVRDDWYRERGPGRDWHPRDGREGREGREGRDHDHDHRGSGRGHGRH